MESKAQQLIRGTDIMPWEFARPAAIDPDDIPGLVELARTAGFDVESAEYLEESDTIILFAVDDPRETVKNYTSPVRPPKVKPKDALVDLLGQLAGDATPKTIATLLERQKQLEAALLRYVVDG